MRSIFKLQTKNPRIFLKSYLKRAYTTTSQQKKGLQFTYRKELALGAAGLAFASLVFSGSNSEPILNESKKRKQRIVILDDEEDDDDDPLEKMEARRQENIKNKPSLNQIFSLSDFETVAKGVLLPGTWGYYSTGSDDEISLRENHYAYGRIFFRPKCLVDVTDVSLETEMLGTKFGAPFYITAFAGSGIAHPDAERNLLIAAGKERVNHLVPYQLSIDPEEYHSNVLPGQSNFQQLHFYTQAQFDDAPDYLKKFETERPNVKGFFINVDLPAIGNREKDFKIRLSTDPESNEQLNNFVNSSVEYLCLDWDDFKKLKDSTKLPIVLKGVLRKEDVLKAAQLGFAGALISNHGGRQLDFAMPPIEILAESKKLLKEHNLDKNFDIYVDGGIRRGSDIIKAMCLGASGVGLGRPFLYAMGTYGEAGVERAIKILKTEMIRDMKLLGVSKVSDLNEDLVDITSLKYKGIHNGDSLYNTNYTELPGPVFKKQV